MSSNPFKAMRLSKTSKKPEEAAARDNAFSSVQPDEPAAAPAANPFDSVRLLDPFGKGKSPKSRPKAVQKTTAAAVSVIPEANAPDNSAARVPVEKPAPSAAMPVKPAASSEVAKPAFVASTLTDMSGPSSHTSPFASIRLLDPFAEAKEAKEASETHDDSSSTRSAAVASRRLINLKQMPELA